MLALTRTTGPVLRRLLAVIGIDIGVLAARSIVETRSQSHLLAESLERGIHVDAAVPRTEGADPAMATETYTRLVDDLDGGRAERTVSFSLDGRQFSIDLSKRNIAAL